MKTENQPKLHIFLIRHAEKNEEGNKISRRGRKQAELLANRLKNMEITKIYSSDLNRCKETAEIINKVLKIPVYFDSNLREVEGYVKERPREHAKKIKIIKKLWRSITKNKGRILLVGSGNINRILIAIALNIPIQKSRFIQIPTGLTHMEYFSKNQVRFEYVNDSSHLPEELKVRQAY